jgi:hypothetical protein
MRGLKWEMLIVGFRYGYIRFVIAKKIIIRRRTEDGRFAAEIGVHDTKVFEGCARSGQAIYYK